jgi:hypothetical protein
MKRWLFIALCLCISYSPIFSAEKANLDIAPFGSLRYWSETTGPLGHEVKLADGMKVVASDSAACLGVMWWEARDVQRVAIDCEGPVSHDFAQVVRVQYWRATWPETPPEMPTKEDLEDDPWRGEWTMAATEAHVDGHRVEYTFLPLRPSENQNASYLPDSVCYRRTLKIRLLLPPMRAKVQSLHVYSMAAETEATIRFEFNCSGQKSVEMEGSLEVFNGRLRSVTGWKWQKGDARVSSVSWKMRLHKESKGIISRIVAAEPLLPGSNEETIVTVRSSLGTFSFLVDDLEKGPVYIPHYDVYITRASDPVTFAQANPQVGQTIREHIAEEDEQSYERARKEIPELDPTQRDSRHTQRQIYLPLAADASWQKFAFIWGGNILIDKKRTKARGKELARCNWPGEELRWEIGTGAVPIFNRSRENCQMAILNEYLPVAKARWHEEGLNYEEEAFATLLSGPLSPYDPQRDEQTPAILLIKLMVANPTLIPREARVWFAGNKALTNLVQNGDFYLDQIDGQRFLRCYAKSPQNGERKLVSFPDSLGAKNAICHTIPLLPNSSQTICFYLPFVGDLTADAEAAIRSLDFEREKDRVVSYWRNVVQPLCIFDVPETKFNDFAKAIIPHIRMSATKDPQSGLFMVPAGTLGYGVYANESCFQTFLLDRMGDQKTVSAYLQTFMVLQGSVPLSGAFTGDQKDVFYGVRIDSVYDLTAAAYNLHHGTVLWALARHYLYTRDDAWLAQAAPHIIRAAEWIIDQRSRTKEVDENGEKAVHYGLLPAGRLEDAAEWQNWFAVNAYACLGLETTARAFALAGLPQTERFTREAQAYHADLRRSVERARELCPVVRLRNNVYVPYVPAQAHQRFRNFGPKKSSYYDRYQNGQHPILRQSATREVLYGPLLLIKTGIIDPHEPMAEGILDDWEDNLTLSRALNLNVHGWVDDEYWFSRGGMVFQPNLQNPIEAYLLRHEVPAALRSLYNNFVSCLYPDVNALVEEYRSWEHGSGHFYKVPDEARFVDRVCDLLVMENGNELWLAPGTPERWLEAGRKIELRNANTIFGKVSYTLKLGVRPETIEAELLLPSRPVEKIWLFVHAPFHKPIKRVVINDREWHNWDAKRQAILVPQDGERTHIVVIF